MNFNGAMTALLKPNRFVREQRDESIKILIDWSRSDRESAVDGYDSTWQLFSPDGSMPEDGMRLVIDDAKKALKITHHVPLSEVADQTILREAQKELALK